MMKKCTTSQIKNKNGMLLRKNRSEELSVQIYYVRFNYNFLVGFFMSKAQSKRIIKDFCKYIKDKLTVGAPTK